MSQRALIVDHNPADIRRIWQDWQRDYLEDVVIDGKPVVRVVSDARTRATFSEGQAYAMLFSALMDEQRIFDSLWAYAQAYFNRNRLMSWHIAANGERLDHGAATDADLDMAMALIYACQRVQRGDWVGDTDYCAAATQMVTDIWVHEVDKPGSEPAAGLSNNAGYELIPGDLWCLSCDYPQGISNPSYFSPAYFEVFAAFTRNPEWREVNRRNYDLLEQAQWLGCSRLVPNWITYNSEVQVVEWQGESSAYWGWDGARVAWRLALARYWFDDARARRVLNDIGGFFDGIGIGNVRAEYRLDGTAVNAYTDTFFIAHAANAIWGMDAANRSSCRQIGAPRNTSRQQVYQAVLGRGSDGYYNDSWRLLSLMLMAGYFTHPDEPFALPQSSVVNAAETAVPATMPPATATSAPTMTVPATRTPIPVERAATVAGLRIEQRVTINNNQQAQFQIRISNGSQRVLDAPVIRLYFDVEGGRPAADYVLEKYWDSAGSATVQAPQAHRGDTHYFEIRYAAPLTAGTTWEFHGGYHLRDWSAALDTGNDWWLQNVTTDFTATAMIALFNRGELVYGVLP